MPALCRVANNSASMKGSGKKQSKCGSASVRFGQRIPLELPVQLGVDGRSLGRGTIRNASVSGALIETALDLPLSTNLVVTLTVPAGDTSAKRELCAQVIRLDPGGLGIEWRDMADVDITDLLGRVSTNSPVD